MEEAGPDMECRTTEEEKCTTEAYESLSYSVPKMRVILTPVNSSKNALFLIANRVYSVLSQVKVLHTYRYGRSITAGIISRLSCMYF